ncbi:ATP-binding protein [Lysobacter korlensis]|uniref:histidine kinase n=1 Tax=Lysobacter korlensis TaxID=553636 RepID=A0ABV6RPJ9_9GAMM
MNPSTELVTPLDQLAAVCENATVALFVMDDRQHCIYMNRAAEAMTGYKLEDVKGAPLHDYVHHTHPDGRAFPIDDCPIDRAAPQNNQEQGEAVFVHKDGHFYPVAFTASPIRREGRVIGTVIEVREVAEEKQREAAELAMRELAEFLLREVRLERIVQGVTDTATRLTGAQFGAFFYNVTDPERGALTLYTLSGVEREKFARFPMPRATPLFGPTFAGGGTVCIGDVLTDPRYGQWGPHRGMPPGHLPVRSYLAVPVMSDRGEVLGALFFGHERPDVFGPSQARFAESCAAQAAIGVSRAHLFQDAQTARERAESEARENERLYQEAARANQMKDLFLATVSHELRTPLTAILGWSDMLASKSLAPQMVDNAVASIARSARAQAQIVEDLLDISRIVNGKLQLQLRPVQPASVVAEAVDAVRPAALAKGIRLEFEQGGHSGEISGDPDRLQQVVWNLLTNAVKFTEAGGRVRAWLEQSNDEIEIHVSDTGRGIETEFLPRLFESFSQVDSSSTREHGGLGLGLAIVRHVVELHGGTVSAFSAGPGRGSRFTVRLPVAGQPRQLPSVDAPLPRDPALDAVLEMPQELADLHGTRVLLLEDDTDSRQVLTLMLESRGALVKACASASEGLSAVGAFEPAVIISDIGMPVMDGYEFIRALREQEATEGRSPAPAVALTAYAQASDRVRALSSGFQMHVAKPVHPAELLAVVDSLRSRPGMAAAQQVPVDP